VLSVSTTVSFVVEGTGGAALDMSSYNDFVATTGTVQKITFGTSITTATSVSALVSSHGQRSDSVETPTPAALADRPKR
jgi:hypothetical protein